MPKYVGYIAFSTLFILFAEVLIHTDTVYDTEGYEKTIKGGKKKQHARLSKKKKGTSKPQQINKQAQNRPDTANVFIGNEELNIKDNKEVGKLESSTPANDISISDADYFEQLKANYLPRYTDNLEEGRFRSDIVIRYYKHSSDGEKVFRLKQLKYYIHERDTYDFNAPSNALFYGEKVNKEDIQIVAYTLLNSGLKLKGILPSKYGFGWKAHAIEIGVDSAYENDKDLTLADIRAFLK